MTSGSRIASLADHVAALVAAALEAADDPSTATSVLAQKALRVARLRSDWAAVVWLQMELAVGTDATARRAILDEVGSHYTTEDLDAVWATQARHYIVERSLDDGMVLAEPLAESEAMIATLRDQATDMAAPVGLHAVDLYFESRRLEKQRGELVEPALARERVVARIRRRIVDYLSQIEQALHFGTVSADVWERNREYVDRRLAAIAPVALEQFAAAYRRQAEGDRESRAHALTSCRRVLKSVADALYPATGELAEGIDRVERPMTDDKYISRLCQFVTESVRRTAARDLLVERVQEIGRRLASLNAVASKGVHADVSLTEVDQCLIQTYLAVGDLLRIAEGTSASLGTASGSV